MTKERPPGKWVQLAQEELGENASEEGIHERAWELMQEALTEPSLDLADEETDGS